MSGAERCVNIKCTGYGHIHEGMCDQWGGENPFTAIRDTLKRPIPSIPDHLLAQVGPPEYQHGGDDPIERTIPLDFRGQPVGVLLELHESGKVTWRKP